MLIAPFRVKVMQVLVPSQRINLRRENREMGDRGG